MELPPVLRFAVPAIAALALIAGPTILASASSDGAPALPADLHAASARPGEALHVTGSVRDASAVKLQVSTPDGALRGPYGPFAVRGGQLDATLPAEATAGLRPTRDTGYRLVLGLQALDADASQTSPRAAADDAGSRAAVAAPPAGPVLTNSFVSAKGWVKPGETFPLTLSVLNYQPAPADGGTVTVPPADGVTFTRVATGDGARIDGGKLVWDAGLVPGTTDSSKPAAKTVVVEAKAATLDADPKIVWKNLSTTATSTTAGAAASHGPKVIPPSETFDTARYGDRPFPVVPVDFADRSHDAASTAEKLSTKINDPANPGSTFNLYQEMSYGQLFPHGTVPSAGIATADWTYKPGFNFSHTQPGDTCQSPTTADLPGDVYQQRPGGRIKDGWYQLPGPTGYYGADGRGSALIGAEAGVGALQAIDSGCGAAGKDVYDAAQIADPEIDYDQYDTDKDGVVDFFMMIFPGVGGNGVSQESVPPYDNVWPHSSTLESQFTDAHGQKGYVTDDQRHDIEGRPLWYTDDSFTKTTTEDKGDALKAFVRVGPYNVNPESAIAKASVISHEYGHSLGLPDYYSTGSRGTYGSWNLMATDHSQHMDVNGRQELGWLIPRVLNPGQKVDANGIVDSTHNTHRIDWQSPDGDAYTLSGDGVNNGEGYVAKLPQRQVLNPKIVPSGTHVWWSQAGNDFGCPPTKGHNLDIDLRGLKDVPAGTKVTLSFKSAWNIEWDFDYGFVLSSTDGGKTYHSYASDKGYTTDKTQNPNSNDCQAQYGNGITGSPDGFDAGTAPLDRVQGNYGALSFVDDSYDISDMAGTGGVLRFAYSTDTGLAKAGWFIDDVQIKAGDKVIYSSDFENAADSQIYNGGCREDLQTATKCTHGWAYTAATENDPADHAYYLELRDRAGFDLDGHGEDERGTGPTFQPGLSLVYTDENHGYGNVGTDDPPAQSPVDAKPQPGNESPDLDDAAFTTSRNRYTDSGQGYLDNYSDPNDPATQWRHAFDCLGFRVTKMDGDANGPGAAPGDLTGNVAFTMGDGCAKFDYGYGRGTNKVATPGVTPAAEAAGKSAVACAARSAYKRVKLRRSRRGLRVDVATAAKQRFRVDVFSGKRLVARFRNRSKAFTWNGRGQGRRKVRDGYYVVRVTATRTGGKADVRRFAVRRLHGRLTVRPSIESVSLCGPVRSFRAVRPTFGGRTGRPLDLSYTLGTRGSASLTVVRGKKKPKVVRRFAAHDRVAGRAFKQRITALKLPKGDLRFILRVKAGNASVVRTVTARRL